MEQKFGVRPLLTVDEWTDDTRHGATCKEGHGCHTEHLYAKRKD